MAIEVDVVLTDEQIDGQIKSIAEKIRREFGAAAPNGEFSKKIRETFGKLPSEAKRAGESATREFERAAAAQLRETERIRIADEKLSILRDREARRSAEAEERLRLIRDRNSQLAIAAADRKATAEQRAIERTVAAQQKAITSRERDTLRSIQAEEKAAAATRAAQEKTAAAAVAAAERRAAIEQRAAERVSAARERESARAARAEERESARAGRAVERAAQKQAAAQRHATNEAIALATATSRIARSEGDFKGAIKALTDMRDRLDQGTAAAKRLDAQIAGIKGQADRLARGTNLEGFLTKLGAIGALPGTGGVGRIASEAAAASQSLQQLTGRTGEAGASLSKMTLIAGGTAAATAVVSAGVIYAAKSTADYARQVDQASRITGLGRTEMQALAREFTLVGQNSTDAVDAVSQFATQLSDARGGSKELQAIFKDAGVDIKDTSITLAKALDIVLERFAKAPDSISKVNAANRLFGEEGARGVLALRNTERGLDSLIEKHQKYGGILSSQGIKTAAEFSDKLREMELRFESIKLSVGSAAIPAIEQFIKVASKAAGYVGFFVTGNPAAIGAPSEPPSPKVGTGIAFKNTTDTKTKPTGAGQARRLGSLRDDIDDLQRRRFEIQETTKDLEELNRVQAQAALGQLSFTERFSQAAEIERRPLDRLIARRDDLRKQLNTLVPNTEAYLKKNKELQEALNNVADAQARLNEKFGFAVTELPKIDQQKFDARLRANIALATAGASIPGLNDDGVLGANRRNDPTPEQLTNDLLRRGVLVDGEGRATTTSAETRRAELQALKRLNDEQLSFYDSIADSKARIARLQQDDPLRDEAETLEVYTRVLERARGEQLQFFETIVDSQVRLNRLFEVNPLEIQARTLDALTQRVKSTSEIIADAQIGAMDSVFDFVDRGFDKLTQGLGAARGLISQILSDITRLFISRQFTQIFGGGNISGSGVSFSPGGGGGVGSFIGSILGGARGGGSFLTPFNANAGASFVGSPSAGTSLDFGTALARAAGFGGSSISVPPSISGQLPLNILNRNALFESAGLSGLKSGGGFFSKINGLFSGVGGISSLLGPALIGGSIGSALGGQSTAGRILGGIGGGAIGIGALFGASVFGAGGGLGAAALAALGPIGLIGAPLLIGAILLGKAKQRGNDERLADSYWTAEAQQIQELTRQVNNDRIDGGEALAQAAALRQQTIAQLNQIKTASVRESRLRNQLPDVDRVYVSQLRAAVDRQSIRRRIGPTIIPEFAGGGLIPGIDRGYDSVLLYGRPGELILNRRQQQQVQALAGADVFRQAGVPGASDSGQSSTFTREEEPINICITLISQNTLTPEEAGELIRQGVKTSTGRKAVVKTTRRSFLDKEF